MSRIDIGFNMRSPQTEPATPEGFYRYTDDPMTGAICADLADLREKNLRGELSAEDYKEVKAQKKLGLHFYTPHAHFLKGYKSNEGQPVDSGMVIIDLDGCDYFPELYAEKLMGREEQLGITLVNRSASGCGGHVLFEIPEGLTRQQAQQWMAHEMGDVAFDKAVHELERGIYIPCRDYILYIDEKRMFGDERRPAVLTPEEIRRWQDDKQEAAPQRSVSYHQLDLQPCAPSARALAVFDETLNMTGIDLATLNRDGVRHNTLKLLLPTLCQMMSQEERLGVLHQKMPQYSMEKDCQTLVMDFYAKYVDPNRPMNQKQQAVFLKSLRLVGPEGEEEGQEQPARVWTVNPKKLPIGLRESLKGMPENMYVPLLVGLMPALMALASDVEVRYCDGRIHYLGGMAIIKAEQANNKSAVKEVVDLWLTTLRREDQAKRKHEEEVSEHNKGRKQSERAKVAPKEPIRVVPITISCSCLLKRLKFAQGKTLYSFCNEMDTLLKTNGAGSWSAKYDIYREAFDRGIWGQDYNSEQAESGMEPVAYNWTILSTPGALKKCFKGDNVENGLSSRIMLAEMPDGLFAKMTVFQSLDDSDVECIEEAVAILRSASGFYDTPRLRKALGRWVEEKRQEASLAVDRVMDTYRRRAAVIGFRCGVVVMLLAGKESKSCIEFALLMAEYTLYMQMKNFGPTLMSQYIKDSGECARNTKNRIIFDELPSTFLLADLRALKGAEFTDNALYSIIHRWTNEGWIEKNGKSWTKVKG